MQLSCTTRHRAVLIIFPLILQTSIRAQMLFIGREGNHLWKSLNLTLAISSPWKYFILLKVLKILEFTWDATGHFCQTCYSCCYSVFASICNISGAWPWCGWSTATIEPVVWGYLIYQRHCVWVYCCLILWPAVHLTKLWSSQVIVTLPQLGCKVLWSVCLSVFVLSLCSRLQSHV